MKRKVLFHISTLSGGGAEKILVNILNRLDPQQFEISLVTTCGGVYRNRIPNYVHYRQVVNCKSRMMEKLYLLFVQKMPSVLYAALFLRGDYDVQVAYLEGKPVRNIAAKKTKGRKVAFVHCDLSVNNMIRPLYRTDAACLEEYRQFDKVCFVSNDSRIGFESIYGKLENACVIRNPIDFQEIALRAEEKTNVKFQTEGWKLVAVGRLTEEKSFDGLLRIVSELEKQYCFELWILGEGKERKKLENLIRERSIRSVKLMGYQENPYSLVRQADLFVCSSLFEGYSTAVIEALTLGVPIITTDCAGMREILDDGKYGIITDNSEEELKIGLKEIFDSPDRYVQIKDAIRKRNLEKRTNNEMQAYVELLSGNCGK